MKTLKVICTAMVLALVLSVPAYAGDISTPGMTAEPPVITSESTEPGIGSPGVTSPNSSSLDSADFFEFLLTLIF
jgi:hypothetical protein